MGKVAVTPLPSPKAKDIEAGAGRRAPNPMPESWVSWLMPSFVAANVVAFGCSMYFNDCLGTPHQPGEGCLFPSLGRFAFEPISVNPLLGPSVETLDALGALDYKKVVVDKEWWRLFTCIWLHGGIIHLFVNMLSLLFIGVRLEQEFGFVKIGTLYVLSGFGGSLASSLSIRSKISVGASGALFGLLGAMLSELITNWTIYANKCAALLALIIVIIINLAVGMVPHVDSSAHVGGFLCGFLLGFILLIRPQFGYVNRKYVPAGYNMDNLKPRHKVYQYLLWITALILLIIGYVTGLAKLFNGEL